MNRCLSFGLHCACAILCAVKSAPVSTLEMSAFLIRRLSGPICIIICLGYFFAGLWPFNFRPRNNVEWLPDRKGLHFAHLSAVYGTGTLDFGGSVAPSNQPESISIELSLQPEHEPTRSLLPILSLYDDELPVPLLIRQRNSDLLVRTHVPDAQGLLRNQEVSVAAGLHPGARRTIVITLGRGGTYFYVDGVLAKAAPEMIVLPERLRGRLILGNVPEGSRGWVGNMFGLAVFNRPLAAAEVARHFRIWAGGRSQELQSEPGLVALYRFDEGTGRTIVDHSSSGQSLSILEYYHVFRRTFLGKDSARIFDMAINVAGFVPFGVFCFLYFVHIRPGLTLFNAVLTVVLSSTISAAIELIQAYLPTRFSSLTDLICNTAGAMVGVIMAFAAVSALHALTLGKKDSHLPTRPTQDTAVRASSTS